MPLCADCLEIREPQTPGTLRTFPGIAFSTRGNKNVNFVAGRRQYWIIVALENWYSSQKLYIRNGRMLPHPSPVSVKIPEREIILACSPSQGST